MSEKKPMLSEDFTNYLIDDVLPQAIKEARDNGHEGTPAIKVEIVMAVRDDRLEIVSQELSTGIVGERPAEPDEDEEGKTKEN